MAKTVKALEGGRFLVVSPFSREQFEAGLDAPRGMGKDPSLVVYVAIGGGVGDVIGYEEGAEASQPFRGPTPVDALNAAVVDVMFVKPWRG